MFEFLFGRYDEESSLYYGYDLDKRKYLFDELEEISKQIYICSTTTNIRGYLVEYDIEFSYCDEYNQPISEDKRIMFSSLLRLSNSRFKNKEFPRDDELRRAASGVMRRLTRIAAYALTNRLSQQTFAISDGYNRMDKFYGMSAWDCYKLSSMGPRAYLEKFYPKSRTQDIKDRDNKCWGDI